VWYSQERIADAQKKIALSGQQSEEEEEQQTGN